MKNPPHPGVQSVEDDLLSDNRKFSHQFPVSQAPQSLQVFKRTQLPSGKPAELLDPAMYGYTDTSSVLV